MLTPKKEQCHRTFYNNMGEFPAKAFKDSKLAQRAGRASYLKQVEKYGGEEGYKAEMRRRAAKRKTFYHHFSEVQKKKLAEKRKSDADSKSQSQEKGVGQL